MALAAEPVELCSVPPGQDAPDEVPETAPHGFARNQSRAFMLAKRIVLRLRAIRP